MDAELAYDALTVQAILNHHLEESDGHVGVEVSKSGVRLIGYRAYRYVIDIPRETFGCEIRHREYVAEVSSEHFFSRLPLALGDAIRHVLESDQFAPPQPCFRDWTYHDNCVRRARAIAEQWIGMPVAWVADPRRPA